MVLLAAGIWIEGFANSTGRDWAYFIRTHFKNERIDWALEECFKVETEFPRSTGLVGWCNEQGLGRLRAIASELRSAATELHDLRRDEISTGRQDIDLTNSPA